MQTINSSEHSYKKTAQFFTKPSESIAWTVNQILGVDVVAEYHAKPYTYFKGRGVTILDWKVLIIAHPHIFIQKKNTFFVHPEKIQEFLVRWKANLDNPKAYSPMDHTYLRAARI